MKIANWLVLNGVEYEYERRYVHQSALKENLTYLPDFYYPKADLYHEHFAINSQGKAPPFFREGYVDKIELKRKLHSENKTTLIETHSAHFSDGTIFDLLEQKLREHNVPFNPLKKEKVDHLITETFNPETHLLLFITFLSHFKANNAAVEDIKKNISNLKDQHRASLFLRLFDSIHKLYSDRLSEANEVDFQDQINLACNLIETKKYQHSFKYVLVDEFQDTSQDRKRMIQALLNQNENIKLFAVGDDWQSIYRFAGADIEIMTHFPDHFGATSQNYLTQTYRSFQGIVDVAATFIQQNKDQIRKDVKSTKNSDRDQVIIYGYQDEADQKKQLNTLLNKLSSIRKDEQLSVFLLGRYSHLKPNFLGQYANLNVEFSTIHASKGLEADYVILLNVEAGSYGFPSTITNDPLMDLIIPKPEVYPYAEERRLMYVAITRAKRGAFIFANQKKVSPFAEELSKINGVRSMLFFPQRSNPCPDCDLGELTMRVGKYGIFYGCSDYPVCESTTPLKCPKCSTGKLVHRKSKYGSFISCSTFPDCPYKET